MSYPVYRNEVEQEIVEQIASWLERRSECEDARRASHSIAIAQMLKDGSWKKDWADEKNWK